MTLNPFCAIWGDWVPKSLENTGCILNICQVQGWFLAYNFFFVKKICEKDVEVPKRVEFQFIFVFCFLKNQWLLLFFKLLYCYVSTMLTWRLPYGQMFGTFDFWFWNEKVLASLCFSNFSCMFLNPNNFFQFELF